MIILILLLGIIWSLPLYLVVNGFCWIFNISFHLTLIKSFVLGILINIVHAMIFKEDKQ